MTTTTGQQWIRTRDNRTGRQISVAIPSQSEPGKWHLVNRAGCDCRGFQHRGTCRHHRALLAELQQRERPLADGGQAALQVARAAEVWPPAIASRELAAKYHEIFG